MITSSSNTIMFKLIQKFIMGNSVKGLTLVYKYPYNIISIFNFRQDSKHCIVDCMTSGMVPPESKLLVVNNIVVNNITTFLDEDHNFVK